MTTKNDAINDDSITQIKAKKSTRYKLNVIAADMQQTAQSTLDALVDKKYQKIIKGK